jgi:hypothetical protein
MEQLTVTIYICHHHHGDKEQWLGDPIWLTCGCDGSTHLVCRATHRPPPAGTPRPLDWPIQLGWPPTSTTTHNTRGVVAWHDHDRCH